MQKSGLLGLCCQLNVVWWIFRKLGAEEWFTRFVLSIYRTAQSQFRELLSILRCFKEIRSFSVPALLGVWLDLGTQPTSFTSAE